MLHPGDLSVFSLKWLGNQVTFTNPTWPRLHTWAILVPSWIILCILKFTYGIFGNVKQKLVIILTIKQFVTTLTKPPLSVGAMALYSVASQWCWCKCMGTSTIKKIICVPIYLKWFGSKWLVKWLKNGQQKTVTKPSGLLIGSGYEIENGSRTRYNKVHYNKLLCIIQQNEYHAWRIRTCHWMILKWNSSWNIFLYHSYKLYHITVHKNNQHCPQRTFLYHIHCGAIVTFQTHQTKFIAN